MSFKGISCNTLVEGAAAVGAMVSPAREGNVGDTTDLRERIKAPHYALFPPCCIVDVGIQVLQQAAFRVVSNSYELSRPLKDTCTPA